MTLHGIRYSFHWLQSAAPALSLLSVPTHPQTAHWWGWGEEQKRPWLCASTALCNSQNIPELSTLSAAQISSSPIPLTAKKISSVPPKTSLCKTERYYYTYSAAHSPEKVLSFFWQNQIKIHAACWNTCINVFYTAKEQAEIAVTGMYTLAQGLNDTRLLK